MTWFHRGLLSDFQKFFDLVNEQINHKTIDLLSPRRLLELAVELLHNAKKIQSEGLYDISLTQKNLKRKIYNNMKSGRGVTFANIIGKKEKGIIWSDAGIISTKLNFLSQNISDFHRVIAELPKLAIWFDNLDILGRHRRKVNEEYKLFLAHGLFDADHIRIPNLKKLKINVDASLSVTTKQIVDDLKSIEEQIEKYSLDVHKFLARIGEDDIRIQSLLTKLERQI